MNAPRVLPNGVDDPPTSAEVEVESRSPLRGLAVGRAVRGRVGENASLVVGACLAYGFSLGNFEGLLQIAVMVYIWNRERINELFREYVPGKQSVKMTRLDEIMKKAGR